jgi:hypothetical protein
MKEQLTRKYNRKVKYCLKRDIPFELTFDEFEAIWLSAIAAGKGWQKGYVMDRKNRDLPFTVSNTAIYKRSYSKIKGFANPSEWDNQRKKQGIKKMSPEKKAAKAEKLRQIALRRWQDPTFKAEMREKKLGNQNARKQ